MTIVWIYAIIGVVFVSLLSLLGAFTLTIKDRILKKILIYFVSFSAGAIMGDVFIHLLPEISKKGGFTPQVSFYFLSGIILSFIVEKAICWRHEHHEASCGSKSHIHRFTYMVLLGDAFHNFIDGLIIGAAFLSSIPVGVGTTVAVILHEIPHEIGDFGILVHGGFTKKRAILFNLLTGVTAIIGTVVSLLLNNVIQNSHLFLLSFAAANLLYIAGTNLIPELHKNSNPKQDMIQIISFVFGIATMLPLLLLER